MEEKNFNFRKSKKNEETRRNFTSSRSSQDSLLDRILPGCLDFCAANFASASASSEESSLSWWVRRFPLTRKPKVPRPGASCECPGQRGCELGLVACVEENDETGDARNDSETGLIIKDYSFRAILTELAHTLSEVTSSKRSYLQWIHSHQNGLSARLHFPGYIAPSYHTRIHWDSIVRTSDME
ncbi:uncharacterized protein [Dasypus novemcinctus]|uniref:uncharacterized protein isoform X2 n=1 Tax=Dasypus novemcinctus TaxID=9361 RepID=UPI0039C989BE